MASIQHLLRDPDNMFDDPRELINRDDLSKPEKLQVLRGWHADLIELQTATEENMSDTTVHEPGIVAERLTQVAAALDKLEHGNQ
jgi:hypothetical protein